VRSRKELSIEATREALLAVARKHFARDGYAHAEVGGIAAAARVTTGAIYHHYSSKQGLFLAVAEGLEAEMLAAAAAVDDADPWRRLRLGFEKLIDVCASPAVQRIIFIEAPQVIGPDAWRKIELRYAFGALRTVLAALGDAKLIKPYPVDLIARTLLALLHETSAEVSRSKHDPIVRTQISGLVSDVFDVFLSTEKRG
jgi:AcrR family transcriptional regulator